MKKIITALLITALCLSALFGCTAKAPEVKTAAAGNNTAADPVTTGKPAETVTETVTENREPEQKSKPADLDLQLLNFAAEKIKGNFMISPLSLKYALGMLLSGASGETLAELQNALGITDNKELEEHLKQFNAFAEGFAAYAEADEKLTSKPALKNANSVWKNTALGAAFNDEYKLKLEMYDAERYDFTGSDLINRVNDWTDGKTDGFIAKMLPDDYDTENLAVVLINALYYKNSWYSTFDEKNTKNRDFTKADGSKTQKDFMTQTGSFAYYADEKTQLVTLPMYGSTAMTFVLGDTEGLTEKIAKAERRTVKVYIPRFTVETSLDNKELVSFLQKLGVKRAFEAENADFSAMIALDGIYVSDILQKTKITVNESGVKAAAATAASTTYSSLITDSVVFMADRPFSFFVHTIGSIWTNEENVIMFEGQINE